MGQLETLTGDLSKLCAKGVLNEALQIAELMQKRGVPISRNAAYSFLQECTRKKDFSSGRRVLSLMIQSGLDSVPILSDYLIRLLASCRSLYDANLVFSKIVKPSMYAWGSLISANSTMGNCEGAIKLYQGMQLLMPNNYSYARLAMLKACASTGALTCGRLMHEQILRCDMELDIIIGNTLINTYSKCKSLHEARKMFDSLEIRDAVSWGAMITACTKHGHGHSALQLFGEMQDDSITPDKVTFFSISRACASLGGLEQGRLIHVKIIECKLDVDVVLGTALVDMYAKCGGLEEAHTLFSNMNKHDLVAWSVMIAAYAENNDGISALELMKEMEGEGTMPDKVIFLSSLKACSNIGAIEEGRHLHGQIIKSKLNGDVVLGSTLVDMYAKCGSLEEARNVFDRLHNDDLVLWATMIAGYAHNEQGTLALELFDMMQQKGIRRQPVTCLSVLKSCAIAGALEQGRLIHDDIIGTGQELDVVIGSALIDMYAKCCSLEEACMVFDKLEDPDVVAWGAMIAGYAQHGQGLLALEHFEEMQQIGIKPLRTTFSSVLKACGSIKSLKNGRLVHEQIMKSGVKWDSFLANSLLDMYAKCGNMMEACEVFDNMEYKDIISWSSLIAGYAQHEHVLPALDLFEEMQDQGLKPEKATFLSVLKACSVMGAIGQGRLIHREISKDGSELDLVLGSTLVDMYAKSGSLAEAREVFDKLHSPNVISWSTIISGYAQNGDIDVVRQCLEHMQQQGISPNDAVFTSVLAAYSHAGLVDEGCRYFKSMRDSHNIVPNICHYNCIIDCLGRAGWLNEAEGLLINFSPDVIGWTTLLTACKTYGNVELGRQCFDSVVQLDTQNPGAYVLMSNIYTDAHMWEDAVHMEDLRKCAGAWKKPARAWIEVNNKVHEFVVGTTSHPYSNEIYVMLKKLNKQMEEVGYMPKLQVLPLSKNMESLCGHSERLAIAFGLISTPSGTTIRATKNLRVCIDCHSATKYISRIEKREIIIKDPYRIHHFKNGDCSCGDHA